MYQYPVLLQGRLFRRKLDFRVLRQLQDFIPADQQRHGKDHKRPMPFKA